MQEKEYLSLIEACEGELNKLPYYSVWQQVKRFLRKNILGKLIEPVDYIPWPKGCLLVGLMRAGYTDVVEEYMQLWMQKGAKISVVDDLLSGQAFLALFRDSKRNIPEHFKVDKHMHAMMAFLYGHKKDEKGSLPYRPLHGNNHIYADGIGMICPFAAAYAVQYKDMGALQLAMKQIRNFMNYGYDEKTGLFHHVYRVENGKAETFGALGWGRAFGWIVYGIAESVRVLRDAEDKEFTEPLQELETLLVKLLDASLAYRKADCLYPSMFTEADSPIDTSASAMILHGFELLKEEKYKQVYEEGMDALQKYCSDGKVYQAQSECLSLSEYGNIYDSYPWSQGMVLSLEALKRKI